MSADSDEKQVEYQAAKDEDRAGTVFAAFFDSELTEERARRAFLDARGGAVLTTSGALVTLLFGLGSFVVSVEGFEPSTAAVALLGLTLVAFVLAATFGILATRLHKYEVTEAPQLHSWRTDDRQWNDTADKARRAVAFANIRSLASLRTGNNSKANFIVAALCAQLAAIVALAGAIGVTLVNAI